MPGLRIGIEGAMPRQEFVGFDSFDENGRIVARAGRILQALIQRHLHYD